MEFYKNNKYNTFLPAGTKPVKKKTIIINVDGIDFTVKVMAESALARQFNSKFRYYDMYDAAENKLSRDDIINRYDPKRHTEWMPRPDVSDHAVPLTDEEKSKRLAFITDCYRLLNNDQVLEALLISAPKKKDGSLYKRKHTRFASAATVSDEFYVFEIEAYAADDHVLEIRYAWVDFENELEAIENDLISMNPGLLSGETREIKKTTPKAAGKKPKLCNVTFETTTLKVPIETENGIEKLAGIPLSEFKCLIKDKAGEYHIAVSLPAFEKIVGKEIDGYGVFVEPTSIQNTILRSIKNIFLSLIENNFTPWDDELYDWLISLKDYLAASGENYPWNIKKWPKGIPAYSPKFTKEQSLAKLLQHIDRICAFTDKDIENAFSQLKRSKSTGKISPNQNIIILEADFFVPDRSSSEFERYYRGSIPNLAIRTPANPPKRKDIYFT